MVMGLLLAVSTAVGGQGTPSSLDGASSTVAGERVLGRVPKTAAHEYLVAANDLLDVHVFDVPELSRSYRVSESGTISLPLLSEPIEAVGLTLDQLAAVIKDRLRTSGMVSSPQVTVAVKESRTYVVAIGGAVRKPQLYQTLGRTTLLDVISQAEGLTDDAGNTAIIVRGETALRVLAFETGKAGVDAGGALLRTLTVDLRPLLERGDLNANLDLYPGDRVTVQRAGVVYVVGAVTRSGGFSLRNERQQMTVLKAVALAEDLKYSAMRDKVVIIRKNPHHPRGQEEIPVRLDRILAGRLPDVPLQPDDILFVPDSTRKRALRRAGEAAAQAGALMSSGLIIYR